MFLTCLREERGGETDWRTPTQDQDNPENIISAFITKIIDPENPFGTRTLSSSSCFSYPLSWWSKPLLISMSPTTSRSCQLVLLLLSCSDFEVVHVDRVFILIYNAFMIMECSCSHADHVYKMFMLPRHSYCQGVHVVRLLMLIEFL